MVVLRLVNENLSCKLYSKIENSFDFDKKYLEFKGKMLSTDDKRISQTLRGFITQDVNFVIKTSAKLSFKVGDKIELLNQRLLIINLKKDTENAIYSMKLNQADYLNNVPTYLFLGN